MAEARCPGQRRHDIFLAQPSEAAGHREGRPPQRRQPGPCLPAQRAQTTTRWPRLSTLGLFRFALARCAMFAVALVTAACGVPQVLQPSELRSAPLRCGCESYRIYLYVGVNDTDDTAIAWHVQAPDYTNDLNAPIAQTLSSGLRAHAARCNYELVDDAPRVLNPTHVFDPMFKALYRPGDVIMWVGSTYHEDFLKGCPSHEAVSCILYWTDSAAPTVPLDNATEIWTYAHGMARQLRSSDLYGGTRKPVRFVPPGYIRHSWMPENISETRHVHRCARRVADLYFLHPDECATLSLMRCTRVAGSPCLVHQRATCAKNAFIASRRSFRRWVDCQWRCQAPATCASTQSRIRGETMAGRNSPAGVPTRHSSIFIASPASRSRRSVCRSFFRWVPSCGPWTRIAMTFVSTSTCCSSNQQCASRTPQ